ncbi:50S ribosomal protein L4 [Patescibacteria group bacterium]|nr:50S ribosomal protein L4 [Patescibacteria group bacterium]MBU1029085.1 50S ribosomal protein L4 [Patescibacteria group bacterium]MBU1915804.1 50S ribosomal protein L4 [Patescibacteria group bacterium]
MPKVKIYNIEGKEVGEKKLHDDVFGVKVSPELVHEVVISLLSNERKPYAHTKTRGDVRGGGKKPWKQKGTGRARHGSRRSPIWIGGGITFGPRSDRDYSVKINRKVKQRAMLMSLSDKVADQKLVLVETLGVKDGKTKEFVGLMGKLPVEAKTIVVVAPGTDLLLRRSVSNVQGITLRNVGDLGLLDVLQAECLLMTPEAVDKIEQKFTAVKA